MKKDEHFSLSKMISPTDFLSLASPYDTSDHHVVKRIAAQKEDLLKKRIRPEDANLVRMEIYNSWLRCQEMGLDPDELNYLPMLDEDKLQRLLEKKKPMIEAVQSITDELSDLLLTTDCIVMLHDEHGVLLNTYCLTNKVYPYNQMSVGAIWTERTIGTCASSLCCYHKIPIQLCGAEHYSNAFTEDSIGTAAPIVDKSQGMIGIIALGSSASIRHSAHTLGLAISIAKAVEFQLEKAEKTKAPPSGQPPLKASHYQARYTFVDIIGESEPMMRTNQLAFEYAGFQGNVLIEGESGTGKELYAQAIHNQMASTSPFVAVNCAAIPKNLVESELFGYEGGAFTGAERKGKQGKIELANGGTLLCDEIGDMPLDQQPIFLRVLEEQQITRVGGTRIIPVSFRLIAATHQNLLQLVEDGRFRQDLYYRLAACILQIPPLRERDSDIILLAKHFLERFAQTRKIPVPQLSDDVCVCLLQYKWPGNVRQLQNAMLVACNTSKDGLIRLENLPQAITKDYKPVITSTPATMIDSPVSENSLSKSELDKIRLISALQESNYNVTAAAKILNINRTTLYRKMRQHNITLHKD